MVLFCRPPFCIYHTLYVYTERSEHELSLLTAFIQFRIGWAYACIAYIFTMYTTVSFTYITFPFPGRSHPPVTFVAGFSDFTLHFHFVSFWILKCVKRFSLHSFHLSPSTHWKPIELVLSETTRCECRHEFEIEVEENVITNKLIIIKQLYAIRCGVNCHAQ